MNPRRFRSPAATVIVTLLWSGAVTSLTAIAQQSKRLVGAPLAGSRLTERQTLVLNRPPVREILDDSSSLYGITMDEEGGEVFISDDNRSSILVYNADFKPTEKVVEPRRQILGPQTHLHSTCSLTISPENKEIFAVDNDFTQNMTVYPLESKGDVAPVRELTVDRGAWGLFLDRKHDEIFMTVEHTNKLAVYRRTANGQQEPVRYIQGPDTGLADPHGVFVDADSNEVFVANHGHWRRVETGEPSWGLPFGNNPAMSDSSRPLAASTGKFFPPSITVYSRDAQRDARPLRTIQGPRTGLNWPLGIYLDAASRQLVVANSGDNSVLFFDQNASGDAAPARVIQGPSTGIDGPSGVYVDENRNEVWVTNWNNHSATIYDRMAAGNVAPRRTLRNAPKGTPVAGLGGPGALVYDSRRDEMLVPN